MAAAIETISGVDLDVVGTKDRDEFMHALKLIPEYQVRRME